MIQGQNITSEAAVNGDFQGKSGFFVRSHEEREVLDFLEREQETSWLRERCAFWSAERGDDCLDEDILEMDIYGETEM